MRKDAVYLDDIPGTICYSLLRTDYSNGGIPGPLRRRKEPTTLYNDWPPTEETTDQILISLTADSGK